MEVGFLNERGEKLIYNVVGAVSCCYLLTYHRSDVGALFKLERDFYLVRVLYLYVTVVYRVVDSFARDALCVDIAALTYRLGPRGGVPVKECDGVAAKISGFGNVRLNAFVLCFALIG